jgi:hypothetical protein
VLELIFVLFDSRFTANSVRLNRPDILGSSNGTGRVEVYNNARWGTVCDKDWGLEDAQVHTKTG